MSIRTLKALTAGGAVTFAASGAVELAHHQASHFKSAADYGIEATFATGLLLTLAGLYNLHLHQEHALGALGMWAFRIAAGGQGLLGLVAVATLLRGHDTLGPLFPLAVIAWAAGTLAYVTTTIRARVLPRESAALLGVGTLAGIAINPGGTVVLAALWLALTMTALRDRPSLEPAIA
jgi:hypothetical protein